MLKKICLTAMLISAVVSSSAFAKEKAENIPDNPLDWNVSMMESYKGEKYHPNWSVIEENQFGIFAYDVNSMTFLVHKKAKDKNIVEGTVKTVFTNKDILKQLNAKYSLKLQPKEKVANWLLYMRFDIPNNLYTIKKTEYYGSKGNLLDTVVKKGEMQAIPEESFAATMYNICKTWAEDNKDAL